MLNLIALHLNRRYLSTSGVYIVLLALVVRAFGTISRNSWTRTHFINVSCGNGQSTRALSLDGFSSASPVSSYFIMLL